MGLLRRAAYRYTCIRPTLDQTGNGFIISQACTKRKPHFIFDRPGLDTSHTFHSAYRDLPCWEFCDILPIVQVGVLEGSGDFQPPIWRVQGPNRAAPVALKGPHAAISPRRGTAGWYEGFAGGIRPGRTFSILEDVWRSMRFGGVCWRVTALRFPWGPLRS